MRCSRRSFYTHILIQRQWPAASRDTRISCIVCWILCVVHNTVYGILNTHRDDSHWSRRISYIVEMGAVITVVQCHTLNAIDGWEWPFKAFPSWRQPLTISFDPVLVCDALFWQSDQYFDSNDIYIAYFRNDFYAIHIFSSTWMIHHSTKFCFQTHSFNIYKLLHVIHIIRVFPGSSEEMGDGENVTLTWFNHWCSGRITSINS